MRFKTYSSIARDIKVRGDKPSDFFKYLVEHGFGDTPCILQQKIHGINFGIYFDGEEYRIGTRDEFISTDKDYGLIIHNLMQQYLEVIPLILQEIRKRYDPSIKYIKLIGELAGGMFDSEGEGAIQEGTNYSKERFLCFYDIEAFNGETDSYEVVNPLLSMDLFHEFALLFTPPVWLEEDIIHSLEEWVKEEDFTNYLAIQLSGREISPAEGFVIKSVDNSRMYIPLEETGEPSTDRIIIKKLNPRYSEINLEILEEQERLRNLNKEPAIVWKDIALPYMTELRLNKSAGNLGITKDNFSAKDDFPRLLDYISLDIEKDLVDSGFHISSEQDGYSEFRKDLVSIVRPFIVEKFLKK